jgi:hypothetical protein
MAANPFEKLKQKAAQWFQSQISQLGKINTNQLMRQGKLVNQILPGFMYLFGYEPKMKDTLPYYDRFPLVLPFRKVPGGFVGLNFHYIPFMMRIKMLGLLHQYATDNTMSEKTRLRLNWNVVTASSRLKPLHSCVKHYLLEHVQTRFMIIPYNDWVIASQLPVDSFVGARRDTVFRDSRKMYL